MISSDDTSGLIFVDGKPFELPVSKLWRDVYVASVREGNVYSAERYANDAVRDFMRAMPYDTGD